MADNIKFKIKKGLKENLPKTAGERGCWYLTTDTHELFACLNEAEGDLTLYKVNDGGTFDPEEFNQVKSDVAELKKKIDGATGGVVTVATRSELPNVGATNVIYVITDENATYRYTDIADENGFHYVAVGRDYNEISTINGGTAESFN